MTHGSPPAAFRRPLAALLLVLLPITALAQEPTIAELETRLESATGAGRL